jgi:hypothetical protein
MRRRILLRVAERRSGSEVVALTQAPNTEPIKFLIVQDNPSNARLVEEALAGIPVPDSILLDVPRKDGREVLAETKEDARLELAPIVLSTSSAELDLVKTYGLHANACDVDSIDLDKAVELVHAIENFSFSIVKLPQDRG